MMWKPWIERISDGRSEKCHIWRLHLVDWPVRLYLHNIQRADSDRELHNHPRPWASLVLRGGYTDIVRYTADSALMEFTHRAGHCRVFPTTMFHRIIAVQPNTWTLWLGRARPEPQGWGFLMPDGEVVRLDDWRERSAAKEEGFVHPDHRHTAGFWLTDEEMLVHMREAHAAGRWGETLIGRVYARQLHNQLHGGDVFRVQRQGV